MRQFFSINVGFLDGFSSQVTPYFVNMCPSAHMLTKAQSQTRSQVTKNKNEMGSTDDLMASVLKYLGVA